MTVGAILTLGLGTFSDINHVVTLGYGTGAAPPPTPTPTLIILGPGKGRERGRRQYVEIGNKRFRVKDAVEAQALLQQYAQAMQKEDVLPKKLPKRQIEPEVDEEDLLLAILTTIH